MQPPVLSCVGARRAVPNDIVVHIRMLDKTAQLQQEAVGVLGINLIHAAFTRGDDTAAIISSLLEELSRSRIEVRVSGGPLSRILACAKRWALPVGVSRTLLFCCASRQCNMCVAFDCSGSSDSQQFLVLWCVCCCVEASAVGFSHP